MERSGWGGHHLLVTNDTARAGVDVEAVDPWMLVKPESGKCTVELNLPAEYGVVDGEPYEDGNEEPAKGGRIVMFKATFSVSVDFPSGMMESYLDENGTIQTRTMEGTTGQFNLYIDEALWCHSRTYDVGWPRCAPGVLARARKPKCRVVKEPFTDESGNVRRKAFIYLQDFIKECKVADTTYESQYGAEMQKEEIFHCEQFTGSVDVLQGGNADLFTAKGMICWARQEDFYLAFSEGREVIVDDNNKTIAIPLRVNPLAVRPQKSAMIQGNSQ